MVDVSDPRAGVVACPGSLGRRRRDRSDPLLLLCRWIIERVGVGLSLPLPKSGERERLPSQTARRVQKVRARHRRGRGIHSGGRGLPSSPWTNGSASLIRIPGLCGQEELGSAIKEEAIMTDALRRFIRWIFTGHADPKPDVDFEFHLETLSKMERQSRALASDPYTIRIRRKARSKRDHG